MTGSAASLLDPAALEALRRRHRLDPLLLRRARTAFMRHFEDDATVLARLPEAARADLLAAGPLHPLVLEEERRSLLDGASKLLFRTADGLAIETVVLRIGTGRTTLCVSSQTACAAGCVFCATGRLKGLRSLAAAEILDQVVQAGRKLAAEGRRPRNVVFMGMGEPLHNEEALHAALAELGPRGAFHLSERHLLVSTVGIPDGMRRLAAAFPAVGQALSLHSARQEVRARLMPVARKHDLGELRATLEEVQALRQGRPVMVEYLMFDGLTDTDADLAALTAFLRGLEVHVNLIPFNAIGANPGVQVEGGALRLQGSEPARFAAFLQALKDAGFKATRRYSLGADIAAACGQLARKRETAAQ